MKDWNAISKKMKELYRKDSLELYGTLSFIVGYMESKDDSEGYELLQKALGMQQTAWERQLKTNKLKLENKSN